MSEEQDGRYDFERAVTVVGSGADVMHALVTPEVMTQWMVGVDSVSEISTTERGVGTRVEVVTRLGSRYGSTSQTFSGEITAYDATGLVRDYQLAETRSGTVPMQITPNEYTRTVRYVLHPAGDRIEVRCSVTTVIPGLARAAARAGSRSEGRSLDYSLRQLQAVVEGTRHSRVAGWLRASGQAPHPL